MQKGLGAPLLELSKYVLNFICESNVSSALALMGDTFQARIGIWKYWFLKRDKKTRVAEKNLSEQRREPTTNSTHI